MAGIFVSCNERLRSSSYNERILKIIVNKWNGCMCFNQKHKNIEKFNSYIRIMIKNTTEGNVKKIMRNKIIGKNGWTRLNIKIILLRAT